MQVYFEVTAVRVNLSMQILILIFQQHPEFPSAYVKLRNVVLDSFSEGG